MTDWLAHFGPEFDRDFYRGAYPDVRIFIPDQLHLHYEMYGRTEGRMGSPWQGREAFRRAIAHAEHALEIGPFHAPLLNPGPNVRFLDVFDTETLRAKGLELGLDIARIPPIDYVSPGSDLDMVDDTFDLIVSSHSIEHQTDLVRHLQSVESRLRPGGAYAMLVPDCRYCFDHFRPPSNVAQVLEAYRENRRVHSFAKVVEHAAFTTHNDSARHWAGDHGELAVTVDKIRTGMAQFDDADGSYIDVHNWQFTAQSFRAIVDALNGLGLTGLTAARVYDTPYGANEFSAVLIR